MDQETILHVNNLETQFSTRKGTVRAVDGVSFAVGKGKVVGLVGESGCGKSVSALSILKLIPSPPGKIVKGEVLFDQRNLAELSYDAMCKVRGKDISMIFQEPMTSLNPVYTVGHQVGEALRIHQDLTSGEIQRACWKCSIWSASGSRIALSRLSSPAFRRAAAARDDCHGPDLRTQTPDRRRADNGIGCDDSGADFEPDARAARPFAYRYYHDYP